MKWMIPMAVMAAPAWAQTCPQAPDHSDRLAQIVSGLQAARGQGEATILTEELWTLWTDAPDAKAQALLDAGMTQRSQFNLSGSRQTLDALVNYCPDYAEGYNQRAFSAYLQQDFKAALVDLDRALDINPTHIAALSGRGLTLMGLGRAEEAQAALREAVILNPWLQERALLIEPVPQDI